MEDLKAYPKYKNSEYDWLGEIPLHWEERSVRTITQLSDERNGKREDLELLSVYREYGVIRKASRDDNHNAESLDLSNYKYVGKNFLVMNKMKMWQGSLGISKYEGIVSPAYIVCTFIENYCYPYFHYLLRSAKFKTQYNRISYGIRVGQWDMRYNDFKQLKLYLPPLPEQIQIARYLDDKVALINKFIRDKKKEIMLLKEQKQAEINQAVTRGVNPNAKMKDSGISWIGEVPEHWEIRRLKHVAKINPSIQEQIKKYDLNDSVVFLAMENISVDGVINNIEQRAIKDVKSGYTSFAKNDVVIAKITPCFENGKGALLSDLNSEIGFGTTELIVLRPYNDILGQYLYFILRSDFVVKIGADFMTGSAGQKRIPTNFIENFRIGIPTINEQEIIVEALNIKLAHIEKAITAIKNQITLMQDYKVSLINDVVTGKVDVRNIVVKKKVDDTEEELDVEEIPETEGSEV